MVREHADLGGVGALNTTQLRRHPFVEHADEWARAVCLFERLPGVTRELHVARCEEAAAHGKEVRHEADVEPQLLRDLRGMPMLADGIGREVLEHGAGVRRLPQRSPGAGDTGLRVHDRTIQPVCERREGEQGRGGVAARIRDQRRLRRPELW